MRNLGPSRFVRWSNYGMLQLEFVELPDHRANHPGVSLHRRRDDAGPSMVAVGRPGHRTRVGDDPAARDADASHGRRAGRAGCAHRVQTAFLTGRPTEGSATFRPALV